MIATHPSRYTRAEYIAFERAANAKHEFLDGNIYAMAGGSREHALFAANVIALLGSSAPAAAPARSTLPICGSASSKSKLETYPDVSVVCGRAEIDPEDPNAVPEPRPSRRGHEPEHRGV